jgi:hypothetical protein
MARVKPRKLRRLYDRREDIAERLKLDFLAHFEKTQKAKRAATKI